MASRREYEMAIKIAGEIEKSLPKSARLAKSEIRSIANEASKSSRSFDKSLTQVNKVGTKVFKAVGKAAKIGGAAVAAGLGASIKAGAEFEARMSAVKAISGSTADEMKRLEDTALKYGSTTKFTASEAADALQYMALAGYDADKSIEMLPNVLNLAAAGEMDLARASDQVTDAQSALGLTTEETTKMVDQMAQASSKSNTSVEQLGDAILQVGGTAKILKGGTTELSEVLGLLADNGIKGAEGGTKLRNMILSLTAPTDKARGVLEDLGISVSDSEGNMRSMQSIMKDLGDSLGDMGDTDKQTVLKKIFNKTDIKAVTALLGTSAKRWDELGNEIDDAAGAAERMAETKLDNLKGDITLFKSALEGAGVTIYKELQDPLRELVQTGTKGVQDFTEWFVDNFPSIKAGIEDIGEAIGTLAQPFLSVAGWFVDNPDVLVGVISGIGSALVTYKVVSGITSLASALASFGAFSPAVAVIGAAAAAIGGLAAATAVAARNAKRANLAEHFGKISMSMDDLESAAHQIVGAGDLETVDQLLSALGDSKNIESAMDEAQNAIKKYNWKISAGLSLSTEDSKDYAAQVKSYIDSAQELIDQKGYEVAVSTKLLFGDGANGKALTDESNDFYSMLDVEMQQHTEKLNKYLNDAMENGLTIDTQKLIDEELQSISEITSAISEAENQANWDMLSGEWSGKNLTADNFEELQNQINENIEKEYEGLEEAAKSRYTYINARVARGGVYTSDDGKTISAKEWGEQERAKVDAELAEKRRQATDRGVSFQLNTLMDTYGESIANGDLYDSQDTRDAVYELVSKIMETPGASSSSVGSVLRTLQTASAQESGWLSAINPFSSDSVLISGLAGTSDQYSQAQSASAQFASQWLGGDQAQYSKEMVQNYQESADKIGEGFDTEFDGIGNTAAMAGRTMGQNLYDSFKPWSDKIHTEIAGLTNTGTTGGRPGGIPSNVPVPHAKGGIFNKPHIGMVGEAGTESIIPVRRTKDSFNLYKKTGDMLGVRGSTTFAPVVTINAQGADKAAVDRAAGMTMKELKKMYKQMMKDAARASL